MKAFSFRARRATKHWSIRFGIRGNVSPAFAKATAGKPADEGDNRAREDADDQRNLSLDPGREHLGGRAVRLRAADLLRSALQLLRDGIRVLRGEKADAG